MIAATNSLIPPATTWEIKTNDDIDAFISALDDCTAASPSIGVSFHSFGLGSKMGNRLTAIIANALVRNKPLTSVKLHCHVWCYDTTADAALAKSLEENRKLEYLDLGGNYMPNESVFPFAEALAVNKTVKVLDLSGNKIELEGAPGIAHLIKHNRSITTLRLDYNELLNDRRTALIPKMIQLLAEAFKANRVLKEISFRDCHLGDAAIVQVSKSLEEKPCLSKINLSRNQLSDKGAVALAKALKNDEFLESLDLSGNDIGDEGISAIVDALKGKHTLSELNLSENRFSDAGCRKIAEAVKELPNLTVLELEKNSMGSDSAKVLGKALKTHQKLAKLNLYRTCIGDSGAGFIAKALKSNTSLQELRMGWSGVRNAIDDISKALMTNKTLRCLDLCANQIERAANLAAALKVNTTLMSLDLSMNSIGNEGACALAEVFKDRPIDKFIIHHNRIDQKGVNALAKAFEGKKGQFQWFNQNA